MWATAQCIYFNIFNACRTNVDTVSVLEKKKGAIGATHQASYNWLRASEQLISTWNWTLKGTDSLSRHSCGSGQVRGASSIFRILFGCCAMSFTYDIFIRYILQLCILHEQNWIFQFESHCPQKLMEIVASGRAQLPRDNAWRTTDYGILTGWFHESVWVTLATALPLNVKGFKAVGIVCKNEMRKDSSQKQTA